MSKALEGYFAALDRLRTGKARHVPAGIRITNDAVAVEAGRGKGSIKKSRPIFHDLIAAIDEAAAAQAAGANQQAVRLARAKGTADDFRQRYEAALAREVNLLRELYKVKKELARLTGGHVYPIRGREMPSEMDRNPT